MIYKGMDGGRVIPRMRIIRRCVEMCIMLSRIVNRSYEIADETGEIKITDDHRLFNPILRDDTRNELQTANFPIDFFFPTFKHTYSIFVIIKNIFFI